MVDVVAVGMAKADAASKYVTPGHFAQLTSRLRMGNEDVVWAHLGDSTGNDPSEWVYLVAKWLAARFPAYTVVHRLWNDTNQNYDPASKDNGAGGYTAGNVQTGTGARTLTIYNGSMPGGGAIYPMTRIALQIPVQPHLVTISYGYNDGATTAANYRPTHYALCRLVEDYAPQAGIVLMAQGARATTEAGFAANLARNQAIIDLAASEGYGLVNVTQEFLSTPGYSSTLIQGDGLHPNPAGSQVWAGAVTRQISLSIRTTPRATQRRPHRLWVPASAFTPSEGSPVLAVVGTATAPFQSYAMDPTTQQGLVATVDYPDWWLMVNIHVVWAVQTGSGFTGSTNTVRWGAGLSRPPQAGSTVTPAAAQTSVGIGAPNNFTETQGIASASNIGAPWGTYISMIYRGVDAGYGVNGRPMGVRVRRITADASDTLAEAAHFRGVFIERAA